MLTGNRIFVAAAASIVALGFAYSELMPQAASANSGEELAVDRIDAAFEAVSKMPEVAEFRFPIATKGDLQVPEGCAGLSAMAEAECMDAAYEVPSRPGVVVATSEGTTTTLMRVDEVSMALMTSPKLMTE